MHLRISVAVLLLVGAALGVSGLTLVAWPAETDDGAPAQRQLTLANGTAVSVPANWGERRVVELPPVGILAISAPPVHFSEFYSFEDRRAFAALHVGLSDNPFLGGDPRSLEAQIRSDDALAGYLFFFFFPPPASCLTQAEAAYRSEKARAEAEERAREERERDEQRRTGKGGGHVSRRSVHASGSRRCAFAATLADFYAEQVSEGVVYSDSAATVRGLLRSFDMPPMELVESNGMTFYVFEAQGRRLVEQGDLEKYRLPETLRGTRAHFFWAVGAPSPFPFVDDPTRRQAPIVHVAYGSLSATGHTRAEFLALLRTIRSN